MRAPRFIVIALGLYLGLVLATGRAKAVSSPPPAAAELVRAALERSRLGFETGDATLAMRITDRRGRVLERTLRSRTALVDGGRRTRVTFLSPADQRGVELLMIEDPEGADQQYLYVPRYGQRRRVAGSAKNASFEGSDFTFADLESRDLRRGRFTRLPDGVYAKRPVRRVEIRPPADAPDERYAKVELAIGADSGVPLEVRFFDRGGALEKVLKVKRLAKTDGRYVPTKLVMSNLREGSSTTLEILDFDPDARPPASALVPQALGR